MNAREKMILQEIGNQLDRNIYPCVKNGGIVVPSETTVSLLTLGEEKKNEQARKRGSTTRSRPRTTTWERTSYRPGSPSQAAPFICPDFQAQYEIELDELRYAYPNTRIWHQTEGLWLLSESTLLPGLWQKATFLTGIPFESTLSVRSWGFWVGGLFRGPTWIGPRHTSYPDGSVCAFEPSDGTWCVGDSLVALLDMFTLWALRHLYLQRFDRWPGPQVVHYAHERIMELKEDEYCGCGKSGKLYGECCREKDLAEDWVSEAVKFNVCTGGMRKAPDAVIEFICEQTEPPSMNNLLAW